MTPEDFINEANVPPRRRPGWGGDPSPGQGAGLAKLVHDLSAILAEHGDMPVTAGAEYGEGKEVLWADHHPGAYRRDGPREEDTEDQQIVNLALYEGDGPNDNVYGIQVPPL